MGFNFSSSSGIPGTNVLRGSVDASLAANLPSSPSTGDRYSIDTAGSFENDALILPASYAFTIGDRIEWDGTNWLASDLGDDLVTHEASNTEHGISAFGSTLVDDADASTARSTLGIDSVVMNWELGGSSPQTAVSKVGYLIDTISAAFTLNLPASPSAGDIVGVTDFKGNAGTNNITIGRNGSNIDGVAEDLVVDIARTTFKLVYTDATTGWFLQDLTKVA